MRVYTTINLVDHVPRNGSPVDLQARNGAEWHQLKATNLSAITQPLRVILWQTWASELIKRIQAVGSDPSQRQEAIRLRILTEPDCFKYVRWNPTQRTLEPQEDQAPLTAKEAIDMLQETIVLCKEAGVMTNHHPTRKLVPNMTGAAVTLALILGLREAGPFADVDHSRDSGEQLGSAAGWKGDEIVATNYVEVGIKLPKVPGLTNIMEYFVKSYGTQSTQDCTDALARAAEVARPPETPLQIVEEKVKELFTPLTGPEPEEAETQPETDAVNPAEVGLTLPSMAEAEPAPLEEQASNEDPLPPDVPGMEEANLVVRVKIDPKRRLVEELGAEGATNLMAGSNRQILEAMAQEGWEVEVVNESENLYMLSLPPVLYEVMGSTISIPAPRFLTTLRTTTGRDGGESSYKDRLEGDLVLQNGENIFTLQLGFPFRSTLTISAAGWTRATVGWDGDEIVTSNYVEVGIKLPKVPGLSNIMEYFVKSYGTQSTQDCTDAMARAAAVARPPETPLQSIEVKMKDAAVNFSILSLIRTSRRMPCWPAGLGDRLRLQDETGSRGRFSDLLSFTAAMLLRGAGLVAGLASLLHVGAEPLIQIPPHIQNLELSTPKPVTAAQMQEFKQDFVDDDQMDAQEVRAHFKGGISDVELYQFFLDSDKDQSGDVSLQEYVDYAAMLN
eukprot:s3811_g5.t1